MEGRLLLLLLGFLAFTAAQLEDEPYDATNKAMVLNSAQQWAAVKNAENNQSPLQTALLNVGKTMNAANAQIEAQKSDPTSTPESVAAGTAYSLTGANPGTTNAVLSLAKEGVGNAVANLPQALQNFQQMQAGQGNAQQSLPGAVLSGLQSQLAGLIGGPDTTVTTVPNTQATQSAPATTLQPQTPAMKEQTAIFSGQQKLLNVESASSNMFNEGAPWVGQSEGSAPKGFKAEYIAPTSGEDFYALSPAARAKAILNSNPNIVPGAVAFPGRGNGGIAALAATNDLGTGPAPISGGAHVQPLGTTFGATLGQDQPSMLSSRAPLRTSDGQQQAVAAAYQSYAQMKPTGGFGIPDTLPQTTVLRTQAGPDKLPITMTFGRKLRL